VESDGAGLDRRSAARPIGEAERDERHDRCAQGISGLLSTSGKVALFRRFDRYGILCQCTLLTGVKECRQETSF
jgi:hypothetical protein